MRDAIQLAVIAVVLAAVVAKALHLSRPGTNRPAAAFMLGCALTLAFSLVLELHAVTPHLDEALGERWSYALRHTVAISVAFLLRSAFLCWVWEPGRARVRRLRIHTAILGAILVLRWALAGFGTDADAAAALQDSDWLAAPWSAAAVSLYVAYMLSSTISVAILANVWARDPDTRPWTRRGLRLIALGVIVIGFYLLHRLAYLILALLDAAPAYDQYLVEWALIAVGAILTSLGLAAPLVATTVPAAVRLARDRAAYGRLAPLWAALVAVRPEVVMVLRPAWWPARFHRLWDTFSLGRLDQRLHHRIIECWDVLVYLHPHLDARVRATTYIRARADGHDHDTADALAHTSMIHTALHHHRRRHPPVPGHHRARTLDTQSTLAANVTWWTRISKHWKNGEGFLPSEPAEVALEGPVPREARRAT
ncbi:MAB_1171c family putative transporter [Actinoalloteichus caeruleus]|uniref:MAB_1171c family putative transporter n=1 Tax=Actinoalloteichus cyanogriseus TaxID=2893586 RepID=UPI003BB98D0B